MRRGKRFLKDENMFIYVGTAIFVLLAVALGIIMYMTAKTGVKIENNSGQASQETQVEENTESVSTEIGKTVEEQKDVTEPIDTSSKENTTNESTVNEKTTNVTNTAEKKVTNTQTKKEKQTNEVVSTPDEPDTTANTNTSSEENVIETKKELTFAKPVEGEIICEFAKENLIYSETLKEWVTHTAIDIKADKTSVIKSSADGVVKSIINDPRYGLTVVIEHDEGYETVYSNLLTAEFVVVGEEVTQGQTIGTAGNTASFESSMECHLHFELLKDGEYLDPAIYLK